MRWPIAHTRRRITGEVNRGASKSGATNVSSTRDPILLLEPSNLLEPLSLEDRYADPAMPRLDRDEVARGTGRPIRRQPTAASSARAGSGASRWRLKTALVVAGGMMCFGAGAAMPVLPSLIFGEVKHSPPVESAARPAAPAQVTAEAPKPTEPKVTEKPVDPTPPPPVQNAVPVRDSAELAGGPNETAPPPLNAPAANQSAPVAKESVGSHARRPRLLRRRARKRSGLHRGTDARPSATTPLRCAPRILVPWLTTSRVPAQRTRMRRTQILVSAGWTVIPTVDRAGAASARQSTGGAPVRGSVGAAKNPSKLLASEVGASDLRAIELRAIDLGGGVATAMTTSAARTAAPSAERRARMVA